LPGTAATGSVVRALSIALRIAALHVALSLATSTPHTFVVRKTGFGLIDFGSFILAATTWGPDDKPTADTTEVTMVAASENEPLPLRRIPGSWAMGFHLSGHDARYMSA
jgi:hypothetical protein